MPALIHVSFWQRVLCAFLGAFCLTALQAQ